MPDYKRAPEVESIARDLIKRVDQHKNLAHVRVEYVWRPDASKSKGRLILAKARKIGGLNAFLANVDAIDVVDEPNQPFFVIEVAADTWEKLTADQRIALVDHELCHCVVDFDADGNPAMSMRGHDLEEFACIVERHGLWASDVARFGSAVAEQLALAVDEVAGFVEGLGKSDDGTTPEGES